MLRAALIGFGYAGRTFHAPLLSVCQGAELAAIVQRSGNEAAHAYPRARVFRDVSDLLALRDIELVVIATSNPSHFSLAAAALQAGKHVVLDKPMTVTLAEARELRKLAQQHGRMLTVFQNRRWDGDFLTLLDLLRNNADGRATRFTSTFDRYRPKVDAQAWRQRANAGSGVWFDLGPHLLDQAVVAFGRPCAVTASLRRERVGALTDDAFDATLDFPSGLRATVSASMLACAPRPRFTLDGTQASWVKFGLDPQEAALKAGRIPTGEDWGCDSSDHYGTLTTPAADGSFVPKRTPTRCGDYPAFYAAVRDAVLHRLPPPVLTDDAVFLMELLEAGIRSSEQRATIAL